MAIKVKQSATEYAQIQSDVMTASTTIREGMTIGYSSGTLQEVTATTGVIGIATETRTSPATAGAMQIPFVPLGSQGCWPVLCSATVAKGALVRPAANGVTTHTTGVATVQTLVGILAEAGAAGELAGCWLSTGGLSTGA